MLPLGLLIREIDVEESPGAYAAPGADSADGAADAGGGRAVVKAFAPRRGTPWSIMSGTMATRRFWRYFLLTILLINIKQIYRHLDATLPKWMVRTGAHPFPVKYFSPWQPRCSPGSHPANTAGSLGITGDR
jgi:hypothetical protein